MPETTSIFPAQARWDDRHLVARKQAVCYDQHAAQIQRNKSIPYRPDPRQRPHAGLGADCALALSYAASRQIFHT